MLIESSIGSRASPTADGVELVARVLQLRNESIELECCDELGRNAWRARNLEIVVGLDKRGGEIERQMDAIEAEAERYRRRIFQKLEERFCGLPYPQIPNWMEKETRPINLIF